METVQQNGRFTLFYSKFHSNIYSILFGPPVEPDQPDRISEKLTSNPNSGSGHTDNKAKLVVEFKHPVVDVDLIELHVAHQIGEKVRHLDLDHFQSN